MTTILKRQIGASVMIGAVGISLVGTAGRADAEPEIIPGITVLTIVRWHGADCIPARSADGQRDMCNTVAEPRSDTVVEHGKAIGDLVGVDPVMGNASWVSCEMFLNGSPYMSDSALAGDGSDATCLVVLQ